MKRAVFVAFALVAGCMLMAPAPQVKTLEATNLIIRDSQGRMRCALGMGKEADNPTLVMFAPDGSRRLVLTLSGPEAIPVVALSHGQTSIMAGVKADDSAGVGLTDAKGAERVQLTIEPSGTPHLILADPPGKIAGKLP